jgi:methylase of polypeptide subunit release factors
MSEWHARETAAHWDAHAGDRLATRAEQQDILLVLRAAGELGGGAGLDLGLGSGLVVEAVLETLREARLVGVDVRLRCSNWRASGLIASTRVSSVAGLGLRGARRAA